MREAQVCTEFDIHKRCSHFDKKKDAENPYFTKGLILFRGLVACGHSFYLFYINRAYIQYFLYTTRREPILISSLLPLG
jgi:hypothetical protein